MNTSSGTSNKTSVPAFVLPPTSNISSASSGFSFVSSTPSNISSASSGFNFASPTASNITAASSVIKDKSSEKKKPATNASTQTEEELHVYEFMNGLQELLKSGQFSDVTLNVKDKEFRAHKSILAAHSPVFVAMMVHDTKEKASGVVYIEDCEPDTFSDFLQFIYSGNTQNLLNSENVVDLYTVADKYRVTELCKECVIYMMNHISVETFCEIMALSLRHHERNLSELATQYFLKNAVQIVKSAKWLTFLKENVVAGNELFLKALELKFV